MNMRFSLPLVWRLAGLLGLLGLGLAFSWQMDAHPHDGWCGYSFWFLSLWAALLLWACVACGQRRARVILPLLGLGSALAAWGALQQGTTVCSWGDVANAAALAAAFSCFAWVLRRYLMLWRASARCCCRVELALLPALLLAGVAAACLHPSEAEVRARIAAAVPGDEPLEWNAAQRCYTVRGHDWVYGFNASGEPLGRR